jgi:glutamine synthetase
MLSSNSPGEVQQDLEDRGVRLVAITMVDNGGVTRVKTVPVRRFEVAAINGVGMSDVWAVAGVDDNFAFVSSFDSPSGDMRLFPDPGATRRLAASPEWAWAPGDLRSQELEIMPTCQRSTLKRVVQQGEQLGIEFKLAFEAEMTLMDLDERPVHRGPGHSMRVLEQLQPFALQLVEALHAEGIHVEQIHPEFYPGQFEVSVAARDPVAAADEFVLLRLTALQVARKNGLKVSFAPVVFPDEGAAGAHLHLSAWRDGVNLMQHVMSPEDQSTDGGSIIAGIVRHLPEILAVLAPSVLSYYRLRPQHWAGAYACWGVENREAAVRFIPGTATDRASLANIEIKAADGGTNPYLAVAAILACALQGLQVPAPLPPPVQVDPCRLTESERSDLQIERLPASLGEAVEALAGSSLVQETFGRRLLDAFVAVRTAESKAFAAKDVAELVEAYRWRY